MAAKMHLETSKETYKKRKETVEWPFGNIKQIRSKLERNVPAIGTIRMSVANSASKVGIFLWVRTIVNPKCQC